MNIQFVFIILETILILGYFIFTRNSSPETVSDITAKINIIISYADAFASWAKQFMSKNSGTEKMNEVVNQLKIVADKYNINMSETEIRAMAQKAYDNMVAEEKKNN